MQNFLQIRFFKNCVYLHCPLLPVQPLPSAADWRPSKEPQSGQGTRGPHRPDKVETQRLRPRPQRQGLTPKSANYTPLLNDLAASRRGRQWRFFQKNTFLQQLPVVLMLIVYGIKSVYWYEFQMETVCFAAAAKNQAFPCRLRPCTLTQTPSQ